MIKIIIIIIIVLKYGVVFLLRLLSPNLFGKKQAKIIRKIRLKCFFQLM